MLRFRWRRGEAEGQHECGVESAGAAKPRVASAKPAGAMVRALRTLEGDQSRCAPTAVAAAAGRKLKPVLRAVA